MSLSRAWHATTAAAVVIPREVPHELIITGFIRTQFSTGGIPTCSLLKETRLMHDGSTMGTMYVRLLLSMHGIWE